MSDIRIVEYQRKYAAGLAKMWNMSADNWGGFDSLETEESVIQENEGSENLKIWLALDGEEVVGYCCFSEYREDEGASYIPLLNVRPDYHSKKVGKALVLKATEQACQYQWPRLDLYTWPGNTKAVPLYKKCGFFWEDRDDTTHLMNFIPHVMHTEAVADFFKDASWYADSTREIEVQPDGRKENGFDYYGYHWQHGEKMLRMEFERRGRGIRLIETEDWLAEASVEDLNLAFGRKYSVSYRLVNKSGKPLEVSIEGKDDKNIAFNLERTVTVQDETVVEAQFQVGEINEEQNVFRTHPGVCAQLLINGKKALFKVGIVPKFPAMITAIVPDKECFAGSQGNFYLNMENNYKSPAAFKFTLPQADFIQLEQRDFEVRMEAGEKKAVQVPYTLTGLGLWTGQVSISALPQSGEGVEYQRQLTALFAGSGVSFGGETDDRWFVVNGKYRLALQKFNNVLEASPLEKEPHPTNFMRPQVGMPYSVEFAKTRPVQVEQGVENGVAYIRALYQPKSHPGLDIERRAFLQADGLAWQTWGFKNTGDKPMEKLWFRSMVRQSMQSALVPLAGVVEARDGYGEYITNFPLAELSENWVFSQAGIGRGLCWPKEIKPVSAHGMFCFDYELGHLEPRQGIEVKPIYVSMGTYKSWQDFRKFALKVAAEDMVPTDSLEVQVNSGNPFVKKDYELTVQEHKNVPFTGEVTALSVQGTFPLKTVSIKDKKVSINLSAPAQSAADLVQVEVNTEFVALKRQVAVFGVGGKVNSLHQQQEGMDTLVVDNGAVRFAAAPGFGPALISLKYQGREWLDSSFPQARAKSWWNPWLGGISPDINGLSKRSLLREPRTIEFISIKDNVGNEWQGLQIQIKVVEQEKYQGLQFTQYILTLPGMAGLCMFFEYEHSGLAMHDVECLNEVFLSPGGDVAGSWGEISRQGKVVRYKHGCGTQSPMVKKILFGSSACPDRLLSFSAVDTDLYSNREVMIYGSWDKLNLVPGKGQKTQPQFFLFTQEDIPADALEMLKKIRF